MASVCFSLLERLPCAVVVCVLNVFSHMWVTASLVSPPPPSPFSVQEAIKECAHESVPQESGQPCHNTSSASVQCVSMCYGHNQQLCTHTGIVYTLTPIVLKSSSQYTSKIW